MQSKTYETNFPVRPSYKKENDSRTTGTLLVPWIVRRPAGYRRLAAATFLVGRFLLPGSCLVSRQCVRAGSEPRLSNGPGPPCRAVCVRPEAEDEAPAVRASEQRPSLCSRATTLTTPRPRPPAGRLGAWAPLAGASAKPLSVFVRPAGLLPGNEVGPSS